MVILLTVGETMGVASTDPGRPLATATALHLSTAGAEATVAIGMRRLGHTACWVGTVGADQVGQRVVRDLRAEGVDTRFVRSVPGASTGFMIRDHRTADFVAVDYYRKSQAGTLLAPKDVEAAFAAMDDVGVLHITGITTALSPSCRAAVHRSIDLAQERGALVSFDVNYRRALSQPEQATVEAAAIVERTDILFVGDDETHLLTGELDTEAAARELCARGPSEVVMKLGADGACVVNSDGELFRAGALRVSVANVIGAGDSFVAGYLAARFHGLDVPERLRWATVCAACTVGTHGDWEGLPTRADLDSRAQVGLTVR